MAIFNSYVKLPEGIPREKSMFVFFKVGYAIPSPLLKLLTYFPYLKNRHVIGNIMLDKFNNVVKPKRTPALWVYTSRLWHSPFAPWNIYQHPQHVLNVGKKNIHGHTWSIYEHI
jgi:hypothetical protein